MIKKLFVMLLLFNAFQVFAHSDYTNKLFTYIDSSGEQFIVETHSTDGIITTDPTRLKITNQSGKVVHTGEWRTAIISVQDSENKYTVFEYEGVGYAPKKTIIFEGGKFYEGEASLLSYVKSIAIYTVFTLILSVVLALLFVSARKSIIAHIILFLITALFVFVSGNIVIFPLSILVIYIVTKLIYKSISRLQIK